MRNTIITCPTPCMCCVCGEERDFSSPVGLPSVHYETMCLRQGCGKFWRIVSIEADGASWLWADFLEPPKPDPIALATLSIIARRVLGVEAALAGLGVTPRVQGTC